MRKQLPPVHPEYLQELAPLDDVPLEQTLPWMQRLWNFTPLRKTLLVIALAILRKAGACRQNNDLMLPGMVQVIHAFC